jgi:hypothetical protein
MQCILFSVSQYDFIVVVSGMTSYKKKTTIFIKLIAFLLLQICNNENDFFYRLLICKDVKTTSINGTLDENVEDTKGVIIIRKSKKDR